MNIRSDSQFKSFIGLVSLLLLVVIGATQISGNASTNNVTQNDPDTVSQKNSASAKGSDLTRVNSNVESSSNTSSEISSTTKLEGNDVNQSTTTTIDGGVAEVIVNGESIAVPTDGSTVTENIVTKDGSGSTVISVSGTSSSEGNSRNSNTTSVNTSVRTSTHSSSGETFSTDSGP